MDILPPVINNEESYVMKKNIPVKRLLSLAICSVLAGCGGNGSSGQSTTPPSTATSKSLDVRAIDGYLKGAQVWLDLNSDGLLTTGEPNATTDATGKATLDVTAIATPTDYRLLVQAIANQTEDVGDGTSGAVATKVTKSYVMSAPKGSTVVTPLTTLVEQTMSAKGLTQEQAAQEVATQLGLDSSKAAELLTDFMASNSRTYQVYATNLVSALPESGLSSQAAESLLSKGSAIGKAIEAYLAQNPLDASTKPSAIKVVLNVDGSVDDVIKDSDGDGQDDDDIPPVTSDTLASFLLSASDMYMAGDGGADELWTDHWQSLGSGKFSWQESNILIGKSQYMVDPSSDDMSYRLTDAGWTEMTDHKEVQFVGNSDGSVSFTDNGQAAKLTGSCKDVGGKTLASIVTPLTASTQVVDGSATFTAGALGCELRYTAMTTDAIYRIENWTNAENAVYVNGVEASTLADLFSSSAPVAEGPNAIATVFDKPIDTWSESYGNVRLVLVRSAANATSGVAQLWQYNANVQGYQLLSDVTPANHQGWTLQTLHGVTLLTLSDTIQQYLNQGDDYMRVGLTEWQGRVQWVDNSGDRDETILFMNKVAYDDLMKGRTLVTGSDDDNGDGETTPAAAFVSLINSDEIVYSLYQEHGALGLTRVDGNSYQGYQLDYSQSQGSFEPTDTGTFTLSADANNLVTMVDGDNSSTIICQQVQALAGVKIQDLLAQITSADSLTAMQQTFGDATFSGDAKAYINQHTDSEGSSTEIVLNEVAYQQLVATLVQ